MGDNTNVDVGSNLIVLGMSGPNVKLYLDNNDAILSFVVTLANLIPVQHNEGKKTMIDGNASLNLVLLPIQLRGPSPKGK